MIIVKIDYRVEFFKQNVFYIYDLLSYSLIKIITRRQVCSTDFLNPIYGVENDNIENFKHITSQIQENIGRVPRSYASVAYDALLIAALAENNTKATNNINYLKNTLMHIANSYNGITGNTKLNQNGDRKYGDYDFWAVARNTDNGTHDTFTWKRVSKSQLSESCNNDKPFYK